ncbi:MAG: hypothetical protein R2741_10230 [Methanolobus sp.]
MFGNQDLRSGVDTIADPSMKVSFSDPDDVVKEEIKKMNLTSGGLLLDEIIRDPLVVKTRVGDEAELKLGELIENIDFSEPVPVNNPIMSEVPEQQDESLSDEICSVNIDMAEDESSSESLTEASQETGCETKDVYVSNEADNSVPFVSLKLQKNRILMKTTLMILKKKK